MGRWEIWRRWVRIKDMKRPTLYNTGLLCMLYIPGASSECIIHVWRETHILESQPYVESADVSLDV